MIKTWCNLLAILVVILVPSALMASPMMVENIHNDWFFLNDFHTYDYASSVDFFNQTPNGVFGGVKIGTGSRYENTLSWEHTAPVGFTVPPYEVTRAKLWIDGYRIDDDDNMVSVEGLFDLGNLDDNWFDNTTFNLMDAGISWDLWNDGSLGFTVTAGERMLQIDHAVLMMDYTGDAIPEPATMALFGLGLLGAGIVRRIKK
jgi:hypothetical protein